MAAKKPGLGKGLESLIPVERPDRGYTVVPLDRIVPNPQQPRRSLQVAGHSTDQAITDTYGTTPARRLSHF